MGVSFWDYLNDRTIKKYDIPNLDQLVLAERIQNSNNKLNLYLI